MNFWLKLFGGDPKPYFLNFSPVGAESVSVSWNFDLKNQTDRAWVLEVHKEVEESIEWQKTKTEEIRFFKNKKCLNKTTVVKNRGEQASLMNIAIHSAIKYALESHHDFMLSPVSGATTADYQNEARALLWIQATFGTLSRALTRMPNDPNLILTAAFFSGTYPKAEEKVVRVIAFNLDILFALKADQTLQIVVFDDKDMGHGKSKTPSFQQIIKVTKPQFYDEIVKLTNQLALAGELK